MITPELKQHIIDIIKGTLGAMIMAALIAGFQYVAGHVPMIMQFLLTAGAATTTIKATK